MNDTLPKFAIVPYEKLDELFNKVDLLTQNMKNTHSDTKGLGDYISEKEAKELLQKGTTWFWNKRQSKELSAKKAGNTLYYKRSDILKFIENGKRI